MISFLQYFGKIMLVVIALQVYIIVDHVGGVVEFFVHGAIVLLGVEGLEAWFQRRNARKILAKHKKG